MNGITAIAKILKMEGVEFISGFPMNAVFEAAAKEGIRPITVRNERVGVGIADGYARATFGRKIGVCAMQSGPGIENAYSGVAQAFSESTPILVLPTGFARRRQATPNFMAPRSFRDITKWADTISFADQVPDEMRRAFALLRMGKTGPVLLEIPEDVSNEEFDDAKFIYSPVKGARPAGDPSDIRAVVKLLLAAKEPVIRAGQGVLMATATEELVEFAELLQIPVTATLAGKGAFPENHALYLGSGGNTHPRMVHDWLNKTDLVFAIGSSCFKGGFTKAIPDGKRVIQATIDERDLARDYPLEHAIIGDAKLVLQQLIVEVKAQLGLNGRRSDSRVAREVKAARDAWLAEWAPKLTSDETPINPYRLIHDMKQVLDPRETVITHDAGSPRDHLVPMWEAPVPGSYIGWGKITTLGGSLGFSMGAKLARPDKTCVAFLGNAAFGMVGMDFETAVRENIPVLVIVVNNSLLGGYSRHHPVASEKYGLNKETGNYAELARALGGYSVQIANPADIIPQLKKAKAAVDGGQAALVEVITREENATSAFR